MRQIYVKEIGFVFIGGNDGRLDYPARRLNTGQRSPKVLQREVTLLRFQLVVKTFGSREAPRRFAAVVVVDRRGRADVIGAAAFAMQGEPDGRRDRAIAVVEDVPDLRLLDTVVPRGPHLDAALIAPIEAVGDHAVLTRLRAGGHVGLDRAG